MEAIILAGGLGTRLREAVAGLPKPMAPVNGKPFLWYILKFLAQSGFSKVIISAGYKANIIFEYFGDSFENIELNYVIEEQPLGTGGAILKSLKEASGDNILIVNGDTWFPVDIKGMFRFHELNNAGITIALKEMVDFDRYGSVELSGSNVAAFREKEFCRVGLINGGVYTINKGFLISLELPEKFSFEKEILEKLAGDTKLCGFISDAPFIDIGIPDDYNRAASFLKND